MDRLAPASVLDLGIGLGKYGVLVREYADTMCRGLLPPDRRVRIVGYEAWEKYRNLCWFAYDEICVLDYAQAVRQNLAGFDLVLWIDGPEHLEQIPAENLLQQLCADNKAVVISTPNGRREQGAWKGNTYECHRSIWTAGMIRQYGGEVLLETDMLVGSFAGRFPCSSSESRSS